jgi:hypothetical protein
MGKGNLQSISKAQAEATTAILKNIESLFSHLFGVDVFDLLGKLSDSSFLLLTTCFSDFSDECNKRNEIDNSCIFLQSFLMTHKVQSGDKKLNYDELMTIVELTNGIMTKFRAANDTADDDDFEGIRYGQNEITEVLMPFREVSLNGVLKAENDVLRECLGISAKDILDWLTKFGENSITGFDPGSITFRKFINDYDQYRSKKCFELPDSDAMRPIAESMSVKVGSLGEAEFKPGSLMTPIDKFRKIFFNDNGVFYCFSFDLISSRFVRCLERYVSGIRPDVHQTWSTNEKRFYEILVADIFKKAFPGCQYFSNNYFLEKKGKRFENDGLCLYKGVLYVVEVKGGKADPDSIYDNPNDVKKSYQSIVNEGIDQCEKVIDLMSAKQKLEILDSENVGKFIINDSDVFEAIPICVAFEEMGAYLPGYNLRSQSSVFGSNVVVMNVFDFLTVLDFLDSPLFITKYFHERMIGCRDKRYLLDDELTVLGLFSFSSMNLSGLFESQSKKTDSLNAAEIYFDDQDWEQEIEVYYSQMALGAASNPKPSIKCSELATLLSNGIDANVDGYLFSLLLSILHLSKNEQDVLLQKMRRCRKNGYFPQTIRIGRNNGEEIALMVFERPVTDFDKKKMMSCVLQYYGSHLALKRIYVASIRRMECSFELFLRDDERLRDEKVIELSKRIDFSVTGHKLL